MIVRRPFLCGDCEIGQLFKIFQFTGTPTSSDWSDVEKLPDYKPLFPKFHKPDYNELLKEFHPLERDFLIIMLTPDPKQRPLASTLLKHPYFTEVMPDN
jgi:serine/threonine protein kinase